MIKRITDGHGDAYSLDEFREAVRDVLRGLATFANGRGELLTGVGHLSACRDRVRWGRGLVRVSWLRGCCPHAAAGLLADGRYSERDFERAMAAGLPELSCTVH